MDGAIVLRDFPLYDQILKIMRGRSITTDERKIQNKLNRLDQEYHEKVFALMYHHHLLQKGAPDDIPYHGKHPSSEGSDLIFDKLPTDLLVIIHVYLHNFC